jgi:hypothetical protein
MEPKENPGHPSSRESVVIENRQRFMDHMLGEPASIGSLHQTAVGIIINYDFRRATPLEMMAYKEHPFPNCDVIWFDDRQFGAD